MLVLLVLPAALLVLLLVLLLLFLLALEPLLDRALVGLGVLHAGACFEGLAIGLERFFVFAFPGQRIAAVVLRLRAR